MTARRWVEEHHAYLSLMLRLAVAPERFDVVHNNSLHYLPVAMAATLPSPLVTTLHTPPTPWLESAIQASATCPVTFAAVSEHTAAAWRPLVRRARVVHNGVDPAHWPFGTGGDGLAWAGRLVPEKGAPMAIHAARQAGRPLRLAGPIPDQDYFDAEIRPLLGGDITYVGHLDNAEVAELFGTSAATLVTPCWDEPYGLVVAQSLACGTPICGFARGALPEIVTPACGRLVPADDVRALAAVVDETTRLSRQDAHDRAVTACSQTTMVDAYERLYEELVA
jgi:glycosyltransferase involved in cell wall biosynthesis